MHLGLEQMNLILTKAAPEEELTLWREHILDCGDCARKFRMLRDLEQQFLPAEAPAAEPTLETPKRWLLSVDFKKVRYALGAAAVLLMAIYPYFKRSHSDPLFPELDVRSANSSLAMLEQVKRVNYQHALTEWKGNHNLLTLIELQNEIE